MKFILLPSAIYQKVYDSHLYLYTSLSRNILYDYILREEILTKCSAESAVLLRDPSEIKHEAIAALCPTTDAVTIRLSEEHSGETLALSP